MAGARDWQAWHGPYDDEASDLSRRLRLVQRHITAWMDERPGDDLTVLGICAGQGRDLLGVLLTRPDPSRFRCTLLELVPEPHTLYGRPPHQAGPAPIYVPSRCNTRPGQQRDVDRRSGADQEGRCAQPETRSTP